MTEEPDERQPPRLQDTSEREALPLPLPDSADEPAPVDDPAPVDEPAPVEEPEPESPPVAEPASEEPEPAPEPEPEPEPSPAAVENGAGGPDAGLPPFQPAPSVAGIAGGEEEGLPAEVLVGAAFLGGIALAFLIKRLGS